MEKSTMASSQLPLPARTGISSCFFFLLNDTFNVTNEIQKSYNVTSLSFQSKEIRQITITSHFKIVTTCHSTVTGLDRIWLIINM